MDSQKEAEMSFIEHLEELRWHIIKSISSVFLFTIIVFVAKDFVFGKIILGPSNNEFFTYDILCNISEKLGLSKALCIDNIKFSIQNIDLPGQFLIHIKSSIVLGFIVAFPYVVYQIWSFVRPGLYENEQKYTRGVDLFSSLFFLLGVTFGYFILVPFSINFLGSYTVSDVVQNQVSLNSYVGVLTSLILACGFIFELPMITFILAKIGLINAPLMKNYRKHAVVAILLLAAIITPPDLISQFLIGLPLYILYEFSILIAARVNPQTDELEQV